MFPLRLRSGTRSRGIFYAAGPVYIRPFHAEKRLYNMQNLPLLFTLICKIVHLVYPSRPPTTHCVSTIR